MLDGVLGLYWQGREMNGQMALKYLKLSFGFRDIDETAQVVGIVVNLEITMHDTYSVDVVML